jgi:hypothetical protein
MANKVKGGPVRPRTKRTDPVKAVFIKTLRETCNIAESARAAGIGRRTAYEWKEKDEEFRVQWDEAEQEAVDSLEREAWRRGVEGYDKPVVFQGIITNTYKEYSDRMLELLLKAHRPEKFKDRVATEHSSPDGSMSPKPAIDFSKLSDAALKELMEAQRAQSESE